MTMRYACGGEGGGGGAGDERALCFTKSFVNTAIAFNRSVADKVPSLSKRKRARGRERERARDQKRKSTRTAQSAS